MSDLTENRAIVAKNKPSEIDNALNAVVESCQKLENFISRLEEGNSSSKTEPDKAVSEAPIFAHVYNGIAPKCYSIAECIDIAVRRLSDLLFDD